MNPRQLIRYTLSILIVAVLIYFVHTRIAGIVDEHDVPSTTTTTTVTVTTTATRTAIVYAEPGQRRANATFVMLARNSDLDGALDAIRSIEDRFNARHGYPFVFLNDEEFSPEFIRRISVLTGHNAQFGVIPREHWVQPEWINEDKATKDRWTLTAANVKYADSVAYRNMCRFNSGFFFKHELMQQYRYYWRLEPNVKFHCDIHSDPFLFMEDNKKTYGFVLSVFEIPGSIRTLWSTVTEFTKAYPEYIAKENSMRFLSNDLGRTYNYCHFWSNFEIADMEFWRGEAYSAFFAFLDKKGGFYYERWGDAPVHSIAAGLFLDRHQIHFFDEIGYQHDDWSHCPSEESVWAQGRCSCDSAKSFDYERGSCKKRWDNMWKG